MRHPGRTLRIQTDMHDALAILVTGGTFDKEYDELTGRLFFRDTHVPEMLRLGPLPRSTSRSRR